MANWADYCIYEKHPIDGAITMLRCRVDDASKDMPRTKKDFSREEVILRIENKRETFVTMTRNTANKWVKGGDVRVRTGAGGKKYLRTDSNNIDADNLGNLPGF
jgi:hypothetical protein